MVPVAIERLSKSFGKTVVLRDIDLEIAPGELFFLLGPSGCGKTTLLRHLAGFLQPDSGTIHFGTREVSRVPAHQRNTAMMFQSYALWPHLSVAGNVAFGLKERKIPKAEIAGRVQEALDMVEMGHLGQRPIAALSGGQQQRVALARSLVVRPQLLLLDEPLSNLDARLRLTMRREIRRIVKDHGLTAVYVTHDQDEALSMADRMAVMDRGAIAQLGSPQEVYRRPATRVVAHFIGETNFFPATLRAVQGEMAELGSLFGPLRAAIPPSAAALPAGSEVFVSVRPESLRFVPNDGNAPNPASANTIRARITASTYLGSQASYELGTGHDDLPALHLRESNPRTLHPPSPQLRTLTFDPADACLVPAGEP